MRISNNTEKLAMNLQSEDLFKIKRSDVVAASIKRFIVSQNLKPCDRLPPEKDLIQSFGCSRGTIRECLKSLEVQRLVEVLPGRNGGVRVCAVPYRRAMQLLANFLHFKDLTGAQIYEVRRKVEPLMAEAIVGLLKPEDFKLLDKEIKVCKLYLENELETNRYKCHEAELEFHNILANACPNPFLAFLYRFINDVILHFIVLKKFGPTLRTNFAKSNLKCHISLVKAYQKEDRQRVRKLMEDHMNDAAKFIAGVKAVFEQSLIQRSETTL
jgi:DNA-binding FadR family transcriptional regulator